MPLEKVYEPQRFEPHWAQWWIEAGVFRADVNAPGRVFSLAIPPPNVTGSLHIGHMFEYTEIDATIRWRRMRGDNTLWLPGADHAGIATQMLVERQLKAEGLDRREIGREEFEQRVWAWKERYPPAMGSSPQKTSARQRHRTPRAFGALLRVGRYTSTCRGARID
jgi:valyl-tRNA synthetase